MTGSPTIGIAVGLALAIGCYRGSDNTTTPNTVSASSSISAQNDTQPGMGWDVGNPTDASGGTMATPAPEVPPPPPSPAYPGLPCTYDESPGLPRCDPGRTNPRNDDMTDPILPPPPDR